MKLHLLPQFRSHAFASSPLCFDKWRQFMKKILNIHHWTQLKKLPFSTVNISIFRTKTRDSKGMAMFNCVVTGVYQVTPVTPMSGGWVTFLRWRQPPTMWVNRCKCLHQRIIPSRIWAYVVYVPCVITNCDKKKSVGHPFSFLNSPLYLS